MVSLRKLLLATTIPLSCTAFFAAPVIANHARDARDHATRSEVTLYDNKAACEALRSQGEEQKTRWKNNEVTAHIPLEYNKQLNATYDAMIGLCNSTNYIVRQTRNSTVVIRNDLPIQTTWIDQNNDGTIDVVETLVARARPAGVLRITSPVTPQINHTYARIRAEVE